SRRSAMPGLTGAGAAVDDDGDTPESYLLREAKVEESGSDDVVAPAPSIGPSMEVSGGRTGA
ncbi:hypothetical protein, partial [Pseudomonas sp. RGM 3321]|uniref:hypothetical protein n=1 Tax=Pseudomonas sp. RGM 3321 TaxID=2930089 RepID=UPI001FCAD450